MEEKKYVVKHTETNYIIHSDEKTYNAIDTNAEKLYHYGKKGMKWGIINEVEEAGQKVGSAVKNTVQDLSNRVGELINKLSGGKIQTNAYKKQQEQKAKEEADKKAKDEADAKAKEEADKKAKEEAAKKQRLADEAKAKSKFQLASEWQEEAYNQLSRSGDAHDLTQENIDKLAKDLETKAVEAANGGKKVSAGTKEDNSDMSDLDKKEKAEQAKAMADKAKADEKAKADANAKATAEKDKADLAEREAKIRQQEESDKAEKRKLLKQISDDYGGIDIADYENSSLEEVKKLLERKKNEAAKHNYVPKKGDYLVHGERIYQVKSTPSDKNQNELKHWGIIGMKWGVRKYQNPDGSLTPEGKKRYGKNSLSRDELNKIHANEDKLEQQIVSDSSKVIKDTGDLFTKKGKVKNEYKSEYKKTKYSNLSNEELGQRINRLQLENKYAELNGDNVYVKSGQEKARETLQTVGSIVAIASTVVGIGAAVRKIKDGAGAGK